MAVGPVVLGQGGTLSHARPTRSVDIGDNLTIFAMRAWRTQQHTRSAQPTASETWSAVCLAVERPAYKRLVSAPWGWVWVSALLSNCLRGVRYPPRGYSFPRSSLISSQHYLYTPRAALLAVAFCIRTAVRLGEMYHWLLRLDTGVAEGSAFV